MVLLPSRMKALCTRIRNSRMIQQALYRLTSDKGEISTALMWFGGILIAAAILFVLIGVVHVQNILGNIVSNWLSSIAGNGVTSIPTAS